MPFTVREVAEELGAEAFGDLDLVVEGIDEPSQTGPADLALAMSPKYADGLAAGRATAALVWKGADWKALGLKAAIAVERPRYALAKTSAMFDAAPAASSGIHPQAVIAADACVGEGAAIGPFTVVGGGARIGNGSVVGPNCTIGAKAVIGESALIHAGVRVGHGVVIGDRFIAHSNAVIGSDGFSYAAAESGAVEQVRATMRGTITARQTAQMRVYSHGTVHIGDDVEIGACAAIDRGTVAATVIGSGSKLDNQVHVGHNVRIGRDCLICGQVGIAGSAVIGDRVVLAGMTGVSDHVEIGDDVVAAGASKIYTRIRPGTAVMGSPAIAMDKNIALYKNLRRLPRMFKRLDALENRVSKHLKKE